jgi:hypothetical protein
MAALRFTDVQAHPAELLDLTSLTLNEFPHVEIDRDQSYIPFVSS